MLFLFVYFKVYINPIGNDDCLLAIGYSDREVEEIQKLHSFSMVKELEHYSYLPFLVELIQSPSYDSQNLFRYVDYILSLEDGYDLEAVIYLVNHNILYPYSQKLADLFQNPYFILARLDRYMGYNADSIDDTIRNVNSNLDYPFYTNIQMADVSKGHLVLVNKYFQLEKGYYYGELVTLNSNYDNKNGSKLSKDAYLAFSQLVDAAEKEGYHIRNNSAYRTFDYQSYLYTNYKNQRGSDWADQWSARAGHSEHQTGLALDVGIKSSYALGQFEYSEEFGWMKDHAHQYGFILRYPKGKEYITGYSYEPWHYRYVGVDVATYIYEHDITFEEYYAYFVLK
ncbi:MAG: M15 family metallopeptidase [bacterium]|nr:M15 family metallopeptidase [bacterium]